MRVIYFVERFWPHIGGVEVLSAHLLSALASRGVELTVVTTRDGNDLPERDSFGGVDIWRFRMVDALRDRDIDAVVEIRRRISALRRDLQPDLTQMVFTGPATYFSLAALSTHPTPTLLSVHGSWPVDEHTAPSLLRRAIEAATWITACSRSALDDLCTVDPAAGARTTVILNGLDTTFRPTPLRLKPPTVMCAARLSHEKGIDLAVEAIGLVRERFPSVRLRVVGDGPARAQIEPTLARRGLTDTVEFVGWRSPDQMAKCIDEASIVVVPSRIEGFGLFALEAMLGARPVVAAAVGGLPEVLGADGGLLIEPESPSALAASISWLLERPERAHALAEAGRRRALAEFPLARCVDAHQALYQRLISDYAR